MNRRGFLQGILIAAAAPAIVRADSLMRIVPRETLIETVTVMEVMFGGRPLLNPKAIAAMAVRLANEHYGSPHELKLFGVVRDLHRDTYTARIIIPVGAHMKPQGDTIRVRMPHPVRTA